MYDVRALDDKELAELEKAINEECSRRKAEYKNQLWNAVVKAIENYQNEVGPIKIEDSDIGYHGELEDMSWTPRVPGALIIR